MKEFLILIVGLLLEALSFLYVYNKRKAGDDLSKRVSDVWVLLEHLPVFFIIMGDLLGLQFNGVIAITLVICIALFNLCNQVYYNLYCLDLPTAIKVIRIGLAGVVSVSLVIMPVFHQGQVNPNAEKIIFSIYWLELIVAYRFWLKKES